MSQQNSERLEQPPVKRLTRRSARFRELAEGIETRVRAAGHEAPPSLVDEVLNQRNAAIATLMGVQARQALWYAPDKVMTSHAKQICELLETADREDIDASHAAPRARVRVVPSETVGEADHERLPITGVRAQRREAKLVESYEVFLSESGHESARLRIDVPGGTSSFVTDVFDVTARVLYEAKASTDRMTVRLAIGQLLDYLRFVPEARGALLLPADPGEDLASLVETCGLAVTWPENDAWRNSDALVSSQVVET